MVNCGGTVQLSGAVHCYVPAPLTISEGRVAEARLG